MQLKLFVIPINKNISEAEAEMNGFLRGHRVLAVKKEFVADGENSFWTFCVSNRVLRGGSWNNNANNCRSANRNNNNPDNANNNNGFRAVLAPAQPGHQLMPRLTRPPSCPPGSLP